MPHIEPQATPVSVASESSKNSLLHEAQQLTEQFLVHFYRHDAKWCLRRCDANVSYLGTTKRGIAFSNQQVRTVFTEVLTGFNPSLVLSIESTPMLLPGETIMVLAQYHLVSNPLDGKIHAIRRRGTLIWVPTSKGLRLRHMHFSAPHAVESGTYDELASVTQDTYLYAQAIVEQVLDRSTIVITDVEGTLHHLSPIEVRSLEADRQRSIINCLDRTVAVRRSFGEMLDLMRDDLAVVRRGFAINPSYLRMVTREAVVMDDGTRIPLPKRRSRQVRLDLEELLTQRIDAPRLIGHALIRPEDA